MRQLGELLRYILLGVNLLVALFYLVSAFSPYINPLKHSVLACLGLTFVIFLVLNLCFFVFWIVFYRRYSLLSLAVLIITFNQIRVYCPVNFRNKEIPQNSIKLLSYNVMAFDGYKKHTKEKPNPILQYLIDSNADILCLQEFIVGKNNKQLQKRDVDSFLKDYPYRAYHQIGEGVNGLACYSKYPIISSRQLEYKSMYNGSALYEILINGDTIAIINNHLESNKLTYEDKATYVDMIKNPEKDKVSSGVRLLVKKLAEAYRLRAQQADFISGFVSHLPDRTKIICGDFNDIPISYTYRVISNGLDDAFVQSGRGLGISYNQNGFYFRIDHILISKDLKSFNCTVDRSIKTSDHYPVWCYISKR